MEMKSTSFRFFSVFFFFIIASIAGYSNLAVGDQCVYTIRVQTGDVDSAGTDSLISLTLGDANGVILEIPNLANWGVNGPSYDYFERGNLDLFSGRANCILAVCSMIVVSDDTGNKPGWKLDHIKVTTEGPHIPPGNSSIFEMNQWLALDEPPHSLTASRYECHKVRARSSAFDIVRSDRSINIAYHEDGE